MKYIEFTDCKSGNKRRHIPGELYYFGTPEQELIEELGLRKNSKYYDGSGEEYELTLPEIAARGWDLACVFPVAKYTQRGSKGEGTIIENKYIFKKEQ